MACTGHRGTRCSSVLANRCWHSPPHRAPKGQGVPECLAEAAGTEGRLTLTRSSGSYLCSGVGMPNELPLQGVRSGYFVYTRTDLRNCPSSKSLGPTLVQTLLPKSILGLFPKNSHCKHTLGWQLPSSPSPSGTLCNGRCPSHNTDPSEQFMFAYRREGSDSLGPP